MISHKNSKRFENFSFEFSILAVTDDIIEAGKIESYYVGYYDSFNNGLNKTKNGFTSHNSLPSYGCKFTDESKSKMSESAKRRGGNTIGFKFTEESKLKMSHSQKTRIFNKKVIYPDDYHQFANVDNYIDHNGIIRYIGDVLPSGHIVTKQICMKHLLSKKYNQVPNNFTKGVKEYVCTYK
jgi:hypothetical protein